MVDTILELKDLCGFANSAGELEKQLNDGRQTIDRRPPSIIHGLWSNTRRKDG